ncbi:MAG: ComF family protein [Alphaproteobacteria bacterium]|nr:ComF family protein [Alphaproteobacteria bacterium]
MPRKARDIFVKTLDTLLPPRCAVSGEIIDEQGMLSSKAWAGLDFIADPFCRICGVPFEYTDGVEDQGAMMCMSCMEKPPLFRAARAVVMYNETSRNLILGFKHGDKTQLVPVFVQWLLRSGGEFLGEVDFIIPVPLHYLRLVKRRYNQAALLAHGLTKETQIKTLPMALKRVRSTPSQGHLSAKERHDNVKGAFTVGLKYHEMLKNKNVLLIDDVYTSGATIKECTKVLKKAGVNGVYVLTLARVGRAER